jgi:hypothetical protein
LVSVSSRLRKYIESAPLLLVLETRAGSADYARITRDS